MFISFLDAFSLSDHEFAFHLSEFPWVSDIEKLILVDFLFSFMGYLVKAVKVDLTYERRVVSMFEVFGEDFFCELPDVFYRETPLLVIVADYLLIFFILGEEKHTETILASLRMKPAAFCIFE